MERPQPRIVGELSNTIVLPNIDEALVLYRDGCIIDLQAGSRSDFILHVQGSCNLDAVILEACRRGLSGMERLSGIPGTIGAAMVQNVAAYNQAIEDVLCPLKRSTPKPGMFQ
jgi:UDP-N-acetylmuramate dehydrogenase